MVTLIKIQDILLACALPKPPESSSGSGLPRMPSSRGVGIASVLCRALGWNSQPFIFPVSTLGQLSFTFQAFSVNHKHLDFQAHLSTDSATRLNSSWPNGDPKDPSVGWAVHSRLSSRHNQEVDLGNMSQVPILPTEKDKQLWGCKAISIYIPDSHYLFKTEKDI